MKCGGFLVHTMKHCYATALYTTEASAIRYTCAYKFYCTREITTSVVYGRNAENEAVSHTKMADYGALVVWK